MASHIEQAGFGAVAQRHYVHAGRYREQNVARLHLFAAPVLRRMGRVVAAAGVNGRVRNFQFPLQQKFDRAAGGLAADTVGAGRLAGSQQLMGLRRLAQQLGTGALAQFLDTQQLVRSQQRHAIDGGERNYWFSRQRQIRRGRGQQVFTQHFKLLHTPAPGWRGWLCPGGRFRRRLRTTWYGRNRNDSVAKPLHTCTSRLNGNSRKIVMPNTIWNR